MSDKRGTTISFDNNASPTDTLIKVKAVVQLVTSGTIDPDRYSILCKQIIDIVLPQFANISSVATNDLEEHIQTIFLSGIPSSAFWELSNALKFETNHLVLEFIVRTLALFVADDFGGVNRLSHVIYKADSVDIASNLIHLPSRISNLLISNSDSDSTICHTLDDEKYYFTLTSAILTIPIIHDAQCEQLVSQLIGRMVVMKHGNAVVSSFIHHGDAKRTVSLIQSAPQACVEGITRAFLDAKVETERGERYIRRVLLSLLRESRAARDACIYKIPFRRPLFRKAKLSLRRLTKCIAAQEDESVIEEAITTAGETWSNEEFALGADTILQRQVTRLLLYYLRYTARSQQSVKDPAMSTIMMVIVQGVHIRLDETDINLRRYAMVVGEAASRHARDKTPLAFDRSGFKDAMRKESKVISDDQVDDDGDSDFSDLAQNVGNDVSDDCDSLNAESVNSAEEDGRTQTRATHSVGDNDNEGQQISQLETNSKDKERLDQETPASIGYNWPSQEGEHNWQIEDDWSSLASYEASSEEEDHTSGWRRRMDEAALRKKLSAPMSIPRMIALLREMNSSAGGAVTVLPKTALAVLRIIADRAEQREKIESLQAGAVEICLEVARLDIGRYPDDDADELDAARKQAFINVMRLDIGECGCAVVRNVVCGSSADIGKRIESLSMISSAILGEEIKNDNNATMRTLACTQVYVEGLTAIFRLLVDGLCEGGGADFIDVDGRDCRVWAEAMVTLATVARSGGLGPEGAWMRGELLDVALHRVSRIDGDPIVRRAVALALGSVVDSMADAEIWDRFRDTLEIIICAKDESPNLVTKTVEWLRNAQEHDADIVVRRFATIGLRTWAGRLDCLEGK